MRERRRERLVYAFDTYSEIAEVAARAFWHISRRRFIRFFRHPKWLTVLLRIAFSAAVPVAVLGLVQLAVRFGWMPNNLRVVELIEDYSWITSAAAAALLVGIAILIRRKTSSHPFGKIARALNRNPAPGRVGRLLYQFMEDPSELLRSAYLSVPGNPFALRFVRDDEIDEFSTLNKSIFSATAFEYDFDLILRRNFDIYKTNKLTSAFIVQRHDPEHVVGMCHVLPLTIAAAEDYRAGRLGDYDITGRHIAARGEPCGAILLFSIGLVPHLRNKDFSPRRDIAELFTIYAVRILASVLQESAQPLPIIEFLAQCDSNEPALARILKENDFERTEHVSRDGFPVWRFGVTGPDARSAAAGKPAAGPMPRTRKTTSRKAPARKTRVRATAK